MTAWHYLLDRFADNHLLRARCYLPDILKTMLILTALCYLLFTDMVKFWHCNITYLTVLLTESIFTAWHYYLDNFINKVIFSQHDITYLTVLLTGSYFDSITVQAPHPPSPQPNLVPDNFTVQQWRKSNTRFHVWWMDTFSGALDLLLENQKVRHHIYKKLFYTLKITVKYLVFSLFKYTITYYKCICYYYIIFQSFFF